VLADVTPPVALAAYAAAGLARSDPMQTGVTAFRLSMGKALVPFMFIYAPSLLFVNFSLIEFIGALVSGIICIIALSAAYIGFFKAPLNTLDKVALTIGGLLLISTSWLMMAIGLALVAAVFVLNTQKQPTAA
jgi:TRAP-type uncharacterized transport system fused permease subunit